MAGHHEAAFNVQRNYLPKIGLLYLCTQTIFLYTYNQLYISYLCITQSTYSKKRSLHTSAILFINKPTQTVDCLTTVHQITRFEWYMYQRISSDSKV